ncbi:MAG: hypothetical protein C5B50_07985 [Verrucomicrobia bacterium]|nr:MAG: hypothetical protein C5B50_07985 [Verrucomicrobiota bacterium]
MANNPPLKASTKPGYGPVNSRGPASLQLRHGTRGRSPSFPGFGSASLLALFLAAISFGVFVLPWHYPTSRPVFSPSCIYGFNNSVAWVSVALTLGLLIAYRLFFGRTSEKGVLQTGLLEILPGAAKVERNKPLLMAFLAVLVVFLGVILGWFSYLPHAYFGETSLFISRIDAMLLGMRPYRDFDFSFGPAMLYLPYWGCLAFHRYFSVEQVYGFTLALHWVLGLYLSYFVVSRFSSVFARTAVFLLLVIPCFNLSLGLNYTPLRFMLPIASLIALHRLVVFKVQGSDRSGPLSLVRGPWSVVSGQWSVLLVIALVALLVPLINFAVSPEMGMAVWLGCAVYFAHLWFTPLRRLTIALVPVVAALPAIPLLFSRNYFDSIFLYSGGGHNLPVFPTAHIIFLLVALFCVAPSLARIALQERNPRGSVAVGLCAATGLLVIPALGRCDPGHILYNGVGLFALFLTAVSQASGRFFRLLAVAYAIVWGGLGFMSAWSNYGPLALKQIAIHQSALTNCPTASSGLLHYSKMPPIPTGYQNLLQFENIRVPLPIDEELDRFLKLNGKFRPDLPFCPFREIRTRAQLDERLADIRSMEVIVVPASVRNLTGGIDPEKAAPGDSAALSGILMFPVKLRPHKPPFDPLGEIAREITNHFSLVGQASETYLIGRRRK